MMCQEMGVGPRCWVQELQLVHLDRDLSSEQDRVDTQG